MNSFSIRVLASILLISVTSNCAFAQNNETPSWWDNVTPSALIEIEGFYSDIPNASSESDVVIATIEFGAVAEITEQLTAEIIFLYEEDETDLEIDIATLNYAFTGSSLSVLVGQTYLPFGTFESAFISDPLTLEIAETRETAVALKHEGSHFSASFYVFNGDINEGGDNQIDGFGANLAYATDTFSVGIAYINSIDDSDTLQESLSSTDVSDQTDGLALDATLTLGKVTLIAEYITALDEFEDAALFDLKPSATNLEVNYGVNLFDKAATLALAYQTTDDSLALELPEIRLLAGLGFELSENVGLGFELAYDDDYDINEGGSGDSTTTFSVQFAAEF